jgi:peptidoglycan hydrolase-like protein with peptidoglycan-binding domain
MFGVLAVAASKKASAAPPKEGGGTVVVPPHDDLPPTVSPSEPEGQLPDAQEASRILLRWWSAEGQSLVAGDTAADRPSVPADFGSSSGDLSGSFGPRTQAAARAFEHYNGLPESGELTRTLLLALRRWQESQALPQQALPPARQPLPPVLPPLVIPSGPPVQSSTPAPLPSAPPPFVPLPPIAPQNPPVVPVPPVIPTTPPLQGLPPVLLPPAVTPNPVPAGSGPLPTAPTPTPAAPTQPQGSQQPPQAATTVSADTAAMVNLLLTAERSPGWNRVEPTVEAWQKPRGLKVDGLFGPKTALAVAQEFGTVPIIRVWPKGSQKAAALQAYRTALIELATREPDKTHAAQLRVSAQREQAQSFGFARGKAPALPASLLVAIAEVA